MTKIATEQAFDKDLILKFNEQATACAKTRRAHCVRGAWDGVCDARRSVFSISKLTFTLQCSSDTHSYAPARYSRPSSKNRENVKSQSNLGRAASPPLQQIITTPQRTHWLQWDAPYLPPKLPLPFDDLHPHLIHLDRPHSPPQTPSRSNQPS